MDALAIERAVLAGYDWGGRAACIVAALWPERVRGLVTGNGYNLQNIPGSGEAGSRRRRSTGFWYQYYFHTERGRAGLEANRRALRPPALGNYGRRTGRSTMRPSSAARRPSTIRISSR